ncbi:hypothetical protein EDB80DRAFT_871251 [Ilyonectria destructans]|nr:hypothetical protein EDB80DRAFT_871251 [Ilyonectria destructans]
MEGTRVAPSGSSANKFDVYATVGDTEDSVKVLASTRLSLEPYDITAMGLSTLGYSASNQVNIQTYKFDSGGVYVESGGPVDMGVVGHAIVDDSVLHYLVGRADN